MRTDVKLHDSIWQGSRRAAQIFIISNFFNMKINHKKNSLYGSISVTRYYEECNSAVIRKHLVLMILYLSIELTACHLAIVGLVRKFVVLAIKIYLIDY